MTGYNHYFVSSMVTGYNTSQEIAEFGDALNELFCYVKFFHGAFVMRDKNFNNQDSELNMPDSVEALTGILSADVAIVAAWDNPGDLAEYEKRERLWVVPGKKTLDSRGILYLQTLLSTRRTALRRLRMLAACEESGRVRDEFGKRGWNAWSADLLPCSSPLGADWERLSDDGRTRQQGRHYQGDVLDILSDDWDLVIAFPPCTDLSYAGARWFKEKQADGRQQAAMELFTMMHEVPVATYVVIENPRGVMGRAWRKPDQEVEPWWFGDPYRKKTCLWYEGWGYTGLDTLPLLRPGHSETGVLAKVTSGNLAGYRLHRVTTGGGSSRTDKADGVLRPEHDFGGRMHYEDSEGRKSRARVRSRTFPGVARAMASTWGPYIEGARALVKERK